MNEKKFQVCGGVGTLFNEFNAFWTLSYVLFNVGILAHFLYAISTNDFTEGGVFGNSIYTKNELKLAQGEVSLQKKNSQFSMD